MSLLLGVLLWDRGYRVPTCTDVKRAVQLWTNINDDNPQKHFYLGRAYLDAGRKPEAKESFSKAGSILTSFVEKNNIFDEHKEKDIILSHQDAWLFYSYAFLKYRGFGLPINVHEAVTYYRIVAKTGLALGQVNLGVCLERGHECCSPNLKAAAKLYYLGAKQGDRVGQFNLANCYEHGVGVKKNLKEALKWFSTSALLGDQDAVEGVERVKKLLRARDEQKELV